MKHKRHRPSAVEAEIAKRDWFAKAQWAARKCLPEGAVILQIAARPGEQVRFGGNLTDLEAVAQLLAAAAGMTKTMAREAEEKQKAADATRETIDMIGAKL